MKQIARFLKQLVAFAVVAAVSPQSFSAQAKNVTRYEIKSGSIVCFTEQAYNNQMAFLAQGIERTIPECGVAGRAIPVVVIDLNMFSVSKVKAVDGGMTLFVSVEDLENR